MRGAKFDLRHLCMVPEHDSNKKKRVRSHGVLCYLGLANKIKFKFTRSPTSTQHKITYLTDLHQA